jgi:hypothetical protein
VVKDRTDNVKIHAEWYDDDKKLVKKILLAVKVTYRRRPASVIRYKAHACFKKQ